MVTNWYKASAGGVEVAVHVQPGAARSEVAGLHGDAVKVRIAARAVEGAANDALAVFMAQLLGLPRREVRIVRGEKSRRKTVWIAIHPDEVERRLMGITR